MEMINVVKHILRWLIVTVVFCLIFLVIQKLVGQEFLHKCCVYIVAYYIVSSIVDHIERKNR